MPNAIESKLGSDPQREPFTTIDDLVDRAEELASGLRKLSETRHPLDIRRGVTGGEEVKHMPDNGDSITVKAGARTYFFDLKETKDGKPFLVITESRFKGEDSKRERVSMTVFPEQAEEFGQAVSTMTAKIA
jgi:hypothetical protein